MTEQLKSCPLCSSTRIRAQVDACPETIICKECGLRLRWHSNAVPHWNHRPEEDRLRAIVEAQAELLDAISELDAVVAHHDPAFSAGLKREAIVEATSKVQTARAKLEAVEKA